MYMSPWPGSGITPACAGNRIIDGVEYPLGEDHPRVCGEQRALWPFRADWAGSPPRVRGTENTAAHGPPVRGITPACAGNRPNESLREQTA